jgi:hypothetical protein
MKYVLGYKRGVVISEQLTPEQKAKINTDQNNYASTFDREMASSTSNPPAASTSNPPVASTSTPPAASTSKPPVASTPKTPAVPATLSAAEMTTLYNFAIGDTVKNPEIGDNTSLAAIAWLIWTRDLAKPENKANIDHFIKNFPGAQAGVKMANIKISSALAQLPKKNPVSVLPEDLIKIGADYTGVNYSKESSDFGIGKSGKSGLSFNQASIAALSKLPSGTVINASGISQSQEFALMGATNDYGRKTQGQPSTPSIDDIKSGDAQASIANTTLYDKVTGINNFIVRITGKIN